MKVKQDLFIYLLGFKRRKVIYFAWRLNMQTLVRLFSWFLHCPSSRMCVLLFKLSPQLNRFSPVGVHVLICTQCHVRLYFRKWSLEDLSSFIVFLLYSCVTPRFCPTACFPFMEAVFQIHTYAWALLCCCHNAFIVLTSARNFFSPFVFSHQVLWGRVSWMEIKALSMALYFGSHPDFQGQLLDISVPDLFSYWSESLILFWNGSANIDKILEIGFAPCRNISVAIQQYHASSILYNRIVLL